LSAVTGETRANMGKTRIDKQNIEIKLRFDITKGLNQA
jgi:hypothetical protein